MSLEHLGTALDTLGADYMGSGATGFDEIEAISSTIVEAGIETPASLTEMMDSDGAASLVGSMFN